MKLSWIVVSGPKDLQSEAIRRLEILNDAYLSASTPIQIALPQWMNQSGEIQTEINHRLRENHKLLQQMEFSDSRIKKLPSEGGWYACLSLPKTADEENIALQLLEEQSVLVHPGFLFDFEDPHLVISLLPEERIFSEGLDRLQGIRA